jgi:Rod binding domain-containing protein
MSSHHIAVEHLANNTQMSDDQKVAEIGRHFEAILLRQFLGEATKPMFGAGQTGINSATKSIYQDMMVNTLAEQISKTGQFGLAESFKTQLTQRLSPVDGSTGAQPKDKGNE